MAKTKTGQVDLAVEEKALMEKYPDRNIVKGSIRDAGTLSEFGNKRTVEIRCGNKGCKAVRRVATSDLHQVSMCPDCTRRTRLERRRGARVAKRKEPVAKAGIAKDVATKPKAPKPIREKVLGDKAAPVKAAPVKAAPVKAAPVKEVLAKEVLAKEVLAKEVSAKEAPTDEFLEKQLAETEG